MAILGNLDWALRLATSIYNYMRYMQENDEPRFAKIIFPTVFDISYEEYTDDSKQFAIGDSELANTMNGPEEDQEVVDTANEQGIDELDREEPEVEEEEDEPWILHK